MQHDLSLIPYEDAAATLGIEPKVHRMPPGPDRWKERSRTYAGIAQAMAEQWGVTPSEATVRQGGE